MKIGIDCRLWNETGVGRYIRNLVWELEKLDKKNEYILFVASKNYEAIHSQFATPNFQLKIVAMRWHSLAEQIYLPQILYKEQLDLMHFPYFSVPIFYKRPFVVTIHDLIINHFPTGRASTLPLPLYYMKRLVYHKIINHLVKHARKIIVPLTAVKEDVMKTLGVSAEKIVVTEEGVNLPSPLYVKGVSRYFLYVGNAYPHKNIERLIEAFILFKKEIKEDVQLLFVGKDDYFYKRLREKVFQERYKGIVFRHTVSDKELFALYANARAFISPSFMEGFGLPALEAMSMSCPVILSDIPAFREVCQDVGFYFDPYDTNALKEKMQMVYNLDQQTKQKHIRKGLVRVKAFSWKKMAEKTLKIYESCFSLR